jgi:hypothetical protein
MGHFGRAGAAHEGKAQLVEQLLHERDDDGKRVNVTEEQQDDRGTAHRPEANVEEIPRRIPVSEIPERRRCDTQSGRAIPMKQKNTATETAEEKRQEE